MTINSDNPRAGSNLFFLTVLILILSCLAATKCKGQVERTHRYDDAPEVVTKFPSEPMFFGEDASDKIVLNICVDSAAVNKQRIIVYVIYPKEVGKSLRIGLESGYMLKLEPFKVDGGYVEYLVDMDAFVKLRSSRVDYVNFVGVAQCIDIKEKAFFRDFLTKL